MTVVLLKPIILIVLAPIYAAIIMTYNGTLAYLVAALVLTGLMTPFDRRFGIPAAIAGVAPSRSWSPSTAPWPAYRRSWGHCR